MRIHAGGAWPGAANSRCGHGSAASTCGSAGESSAEAGTLDTAARRCISTE